jgi:hypothetical protein
MSTTRSGQLLGTFLAGGAVILAGCGASGNGTPGSATSSPSNAASARQAILADALTAANISSVRATMTVEAGGVTTMTAAEQAQLKPRVLLAATATMSAAGQRLRINEIITDKAFYMKGLPIPGARRKWIRISLTGAGRLGAAFGSIIDQMRSSNPLAQAQFLAGANGVHQVGSQVIRGVQTTEYTGYFTAASAISHMPARFRSVFRAVLSKIQGQVHFSVWSDAQHLIRKMVVTETVAGQPVTTTIVYSGYNQPVTAKIPSRSQIARIPGL